MANQNPGPKRNLPTSAVSTGQRLASSQSAEALQTNYSGFRPRNVIISNWPEACGHIPMIRPTRHLGDPSRDTMAF